MAFSSRNLDLSRFCIGQKDDVQQQPPVYDLYAVINHYGGMIGGHYTAYARLPSDKNSQRSDVGQYSPLMYYRACTLECIMGVFVGDTAILRGLESCRTVTSNVNVCKYTVA